MSILKHTPTRNERQNAYRAAHPGYHAAKQREYRRQARENRLQSDPNYQARLEAKAERQRQKAAKANERIAALHTKAERLIDDLRTVLNEIVFKG